MRIDSEIQGDVIQEIRWEPSLQDKDIAVGVHDGVVTLGGFAASYREKIVAERIAGRVKGVKGIANEIQVRLPQNAERPDPEIARAAIDAIAWHIAVPEDRIQVKVENGWVRLIGEVDWYYQKESAEKSVRYLTGVKGVSNLIAVKPRVTPGGVRERIRETLQRGAEFDADHIRVEIEGGKAILRGTVRAYAEKRDAERAARNAPGVTEVDNQLIIDPYAGAAL